MKKIGIQNLLVLFLTFISAVSYTSCKEPIDYDDEKRYQEQLVSYFVNNTDDEYEIDSSNVEDYVMIKRIVETGNEKIFTNNVVEVQFVGRLLEDEYPIFESRTIQITHRDGHQLAGWDIALEKMAEGDSAVVVIPPDLAYGSAKISSVPIYAYLLYEFKILNVK